MKARILLTGKEGQIGGELESALPALGEVFALDRRALDLSDLGQLRQTIRTLNPNVIVNAAAYTAVEQAEADESEAYRVNADAPRVMGEEAKKIGALLVHYSTDYVFDGTQRKPYLESDTPNPQSAYGRSKLAGEIAIEESGAAHLILRTAWVYSRRGKNFLLTVLRLATEREELRIVRDQIGAPTFSREIATATRLILSRVIGQSVSASSLRPVQGIYHLTASGEASWSDFATSILQEAASQTVVPQWQTAATGGRPLMACQVIPIPTSEYPTGASRPAYSVLSNAKLHNTFAMRMQDWRAQLKDAFAHNSSEGLSR